MWLLLTCGCTCKHLGELVGVQDTPTAERALLVAKCESARSTETSSTWLYQVGQGEALISQLPSAPPNFSILFGFRRVSRRLGRGGS